MGVPVSQFPETTTLEADDMIPVVTAPGSPTGTKRISVPNIKAAGNLVYVDAATGNDTHGRRNSSHAFLTCAAAKAAAQEGDTIIVLPGTYRESNLLKNRVNWHFLPGAKVYRTQADSETAPSIFDDSANAANTPIICDITGYGEFYFDDANINFQGILVGDEENSLAAGLLMTVHNPSSQINMQCKGFYSPGTSTGNGIFCIWIKNCTKVSIKAEEIVITAPASDQIGGVLWNDGALFTEFERAIYDNPNNNGGTYMFWASESVAATGVNDWYCRVGLLDSVYSAVYFDGNTAEYKMWLEVQEFRSINSTDGTGINISAIECLNNGKLYVTAQKILTKGPPSGDHLGPIVWQTGGELWLTAQKCTAESIGIQDGNGTGVPLFIRQTAGISHYNVQHWEHVGNFAGDGVIISGGTCEIQGGTMNVNNGKGVTHSGGTTRLSNMRIVTSNTNAAGNCPVFVGANGLTLAHCVLIAPALAFSVDASSAFNVLNTLSFSNKAADVANVTMVGAGLFTDDPAWV